MAAYSFSDSSLYLGILIVRLVIIFRFWSLIEYSWVGIDPDRWLARRLIPHSRLDGAFVAFAKANATLAPAAPLSDDDHLFPVWIGCSLALNEGGSVLYDR